MIASLSYADLFDFLAVRLNGPRAAGKEITINFAFGDTNENYIVTLANSVLHHRRGQHDEAGDASVATSRDGFLAMTMLGHPPEALIGKGLVAVEGDVSSVQELLALLDSFDFWFGIVTP
jgi:alkyl sulfatase BDS1-like metallo-beta-lactamase superfamily hydrolase